MYTVLYVDDEAALLQIGKIFLEKSGKLTVETALSAKEALDAVGIREYDVIISDYEMPLMNGIELLKKLRTEGNTTPFIIFTGRGREDVASEALNSGASFYLQKGGDPKAQFDELINMAERAISHKRAEEELIRANEQMSQMIEELASSESELRQTIERMEEQDQIIKESEERYRLVLEATSDGIWDWDITTNRTFFSDQYYLMLGYEPLEFESTFESWRRIVHPEDLRSVEPVILDSLKQPEGRFDIEFRIKTKTGDYRWIHGRGKVVARSEDGTPIRMVGSHIEITDRKRIEEALLESEEKYRLLSENSTDLVFRRRIHDGVYEYISPSVAKITGYTQDDLYRDQGLLQRIIAPASVEYFREAWERFQKGEIPEEYEFQIITKHGELKWVNQRNALISDESGVIVALQGSVTDITRRKLDEERILENIIKYEALFDNFPTGVIVTDKTGAFIEVNRQAAEIIGVDRDILLSRRIGDGLWQILSPDGNLMKMEEHPVVTAVKEGKPVSGVEMGIVTSRGEVIWILMNSAPIQVEEYGSVITFQDISKRRQMELALGTVNKKLSLLTSVTRHDIKNSLTGLKGYLYLLDEEVTEEKTKDLVLRLNSIAKDISRKIEFTSTYQDIGSKSPEWQHPVHLIEDIPVESLTLINNLPDVEIFADQMLGMVFENLIINSRMHGDTATTIWLKADQIENSLLIIYEDDGIGILDSEKEAIFARGYGKNTGFGLFLIREILSITGISIRETGVYGKGVRFEISVPPGAFRFSRKDTA